MTTFFDTEHTALRGDVRPLGRVVRRRDADWDIARGTFNLLVDQRPEAIAFLADAHEVAAVVADARERGLRVAPQATGHNPGPLGSLEGTVIVHTSALTGVAIDGGARSVRAGAATRWRDVTPGLSELGLAALHGSSPDVGIAGYSLGGGIGWLARRHGMQANAVTAVELVTADGLLVRTDAVHAPELFWALRGGGGNFGVVTALEFAVVPVPELYAGALFFPVERTAEVLHVWSDGLPSLPDELTSWAAVIHFPPLPEVPETVRGQAFAIVQAAFLGDEAEGRGLLAPLRGLGPVLDTFAMRRPGDLGELAMDPRDPLPYRSAHALVDDLTPAAIEELARLSGPGSPLALLQLRHCGGALSRPAPGAGARATLPGQICVFGLGIAPDAGAERAVEEGLAGVSAAIGGRRAGDYPNFVEEPADAAAFFPPEAWARLRRVKALYDPHDVFRGNHHVPPAPRAVQRGASEHTAGRVCAGLL